MKGIIGKLRNLVREQKYRISTHANEEMADDDLMAGDVEQAILTGCTDQAHRRPQGATLSRRR